MVLAKSKNAVGLGNSLMNDRFGRGKGSDRKKVSAGIHRTGPDGETVRPTSQKLCIISLLIITVCYKCSQGGVMGQDAQCHGASCS